jgi:fucokinase
VKVTAPVRIDFAGGWSDTPPICYSEGGTVLAAAVMLDGRRPIEVTVRPRRDRFGKIVSLDLGKRSILKSAAELEDRHDPHDWRCLVKNALAVTGYRFGEEDGLDITISANLPKGSGMGTSSILGAATIAALLGEVDVDKVGALTLRLEQEMRTGGGWEDQFAGMVGGIKMMRSKPGEPQRIEIERLDSRKIAKTLAERSLLYFTGQKRMARNVLRRVIGFYAENPHNFAKILIDSVKTTAEKSARSLVKGDIDGFADCLNGYWRDKKLLDAGSTNDRVEELATMIKPYTAALSLAGAGGGGFMYILAKSAADAKKIRRLLSSNPPSKWARFYDFTNDEKGMSLVL